MKIILDTFQLSTGFSNHAIRDQTIEIVPFEALSLAPYIKIGDLILNREQLKKALKVL